MNFKRAAGIYVAGICLILGGPLLAYISTTFGTWHVLRNNDHSLDGVFIAVSVFGLLAAIVGFFMLVVAAHRALVKIDALQVRLPSPSRENVRAEQR